MIRRGGGPRLKMKKFDMGEGGQDINFLNDIFFGWPLSRRIFDTHLEGGGVNYIITYRYVSFKGGGSFIKQLRNGSFTI